MRNYGRELLDFHEFQVSVVEEFNLYDYIKNNVPFEILKNQLLNNVKEKKLYCILFPDQTRKMYFKKVFLYYLYAETFMSETLKAINPYFSGFESVQGPVRAVHRDDQEVHRELDRQGLHREDPELHRRVLLHGLSRGLNQLIHLSLDFPPQRS